MNNERRMRVRRGASLATNLCVVIVAAPTARVAAGSSTNAGD